MSRCRAPPDAPQAQVTTRVGLSEERTYLFMSKEPLAGAVASHGLVARGCLSSPVSCSWLSAQSHPEA